MFRTLTLTAVVALSGIAAGGVPLAKASGPPRACHAVFSQTLFRLGADGLAFRELFTCPTLRPVSRGCAGGVTSIDFTQLTEPQRATVDDPNKEHEPC